MGVTAIVIAASFQVIKKIKLEVKSFIYIFFVLILGFTSSSAFALGIEKGGDYMHEISITKSLVSHEDKQVKYKYNIIYNTGEKNVSMYSQRIYNYIYDSKGNKVYPTLNVKRVSVDNSLVYYEIKQINKDYSMLYICSKDKYFSKGSHNIAIDFYLDCSDCNIGPITKLHNQFVRSKDMLPVNKVVLAVEAPNYHYIENIEYKNILADKLVRNSYTDDSSYRAQIKNIYPMENGELISVSADVVQEQKSSVSKLDFSQSFLFIPIDDDRLRLSFATALVAFVSLFLMWLLIHIRRKHAYILDKVLSGN